MFGRFLCYSVIKVDASLVDQLRDQDRVSLVVYAGESRVVLKPTSGRDKANIKVNKRSIAG